MVEFFLRFYDQSENEINKCIAEIQNINNTFIYNKIISKSKCSVNLSPYKTCQEVTLEFKTMEDLQKLKDDTASKTNIS